MHKLAAANVLCYSRKEVFMKFRLIIFAATLLCCVRLFAQTTQEGIASYYADRFHGRRTSSGVIYHRDSLTCAHRTLPFGTKVRVKNLKTGKEVVVRVTDRGPFTKRFIIDLSRAAAEELDFVRAGICRVELTVLPKEGETTQPPTAQQPADTPQRRDIAENEL